MLRIVHLVDDTKADNLFSYLDFLASDPGMRRLGTHRIVAVQRHRPASQPLDADIIVSHLTISWRALPGLMALRARTPGVPIFHVEHTHCEGYVAANITARARHLALLRCAYSLFDRVVAQSETQGRWLVGRGLIAEDALAVIPPCGELAPFRALPAPTGPVRTIGAVGKLDAQAGFDRLIAAFRALPHPDLRLRLVGDGPDRPALETLAHGDSRISFAGAPADRASALRDLDAVAIPSRWAACALPAIEARAAGRAVLASRTDAHCDEAEAGAILVGGSAEDWTAALERLVANGAAAIPPRPMDEAITRKGWLDLLCPTPATVTIEAPHGMRLAS